MLRERTQLILKVLVDEFLRTGEPVGSRTLSKAGIEASPATIRNEMADLEEAGFVAQPHASAGRVPTDRGFRFWLDGQDLDALGLVGEDQRRLGQLDEVYLRETRGLEDLVGNAVRILSEVSELAGVGSLPSLARGEKPVRIQLIGLDRGHVMAVLVSASGVASSHVLSVENGLRQEDLDKISRMFNENYSRASLRDLIQDRLMVIRGLESQARDLVHAILRRLEDTLAATENELVTDGLVKLFATVGTPEPGRQRLEKPAMTGDALMPLLQNADGSTVVRIGSETAVEGLEDFALVASGYRLGSGRGGTIGILGPKRIDYRRVVGLVNYMKHRLEEILA